MEELPLRLQEGWELPGEHLQPMLRQQNLQVPQSLGGGGPATFPLKLQLAFREQTLE